MDYIIIGGGASGLACAITLKRLVPDSDVKILEKCESCGKKILATGNGRCNLSNMNMSEAFYNGDSSLIDLVLSSFTTDDCLEFFKSVGLVTTSEEGRIYPLTLNASSVLNLLLEECRNLDVKIAPDTKVENIEKQSSGKFRIVTESKEYSADVCILALGGKAAKAHGTDGDGYRMLKSLGIRYEPIHPALVQIKTEGDITKSLRGVRVQGTISIDGAGTEEGEILFTDYGVSGIAAMQLSGNTAELISKGEKPRIHIDLCPSLSEKEITEYIKSRMSHNTHLKISDALLGILNEKIAKLFSDENDIDRAAERIKNFELTAYDTNGYKNAQVTRAASDTVNLLMNRSR